MKKQLIILACLALAAGISAQSQYAVGTDGYYHYSGSPVNGVAVDFADMTDSNVAYTEGTTHADRIMEFQGLGMYKFCYLASRKCGTAADAPVYGPLAWNNGSSENGKNYDIKSSMPEKLPAVYFPEIAGGVKYVITEGWCYNQNRTLIFQCENDKGEWVNINTVATSMTTYYQTMKKNIYTRDTLVVNSADVRKIRFYRNSNEYLFLCNIQVIGMAGEPAVVPVTALLLNTDSADMEVSQTLQLKATVKPFNATEQTIKWSSSNIEKATVSETGLVTAVSSGEVDITAACGDIKAVCHISIAGEIPVESVTIDQRSLRVAEGKYARLAATVLPTNASNPNITWTSSNANIATVEGGLVHGISEGNALIIATAGNISDTCKLEVYWEMPEASDYILAEYYPGCFYYEWWGDNQTQPIVIDFTKWTYDSLPDPQWPDFKTTMQMGHSDEIVQRNNIGFYQWTIYEGRNLSSDGYTDDEGSTTANVLFNGGYGNIDGVREGAGSVAQCKRPRIYFPTFKAGIHQIRITGVSHNNARTMFVGNREITQSSLGQDSTIMNGLPYIQFGNTWDEYVVDIQTEEKTDLNVSRNSTDYWFISRIEVIPYETTGIDRLQDDRFEARAVCNGILINAKEKVDVDIYSLTGALLHTISALPDCHTFIPMPAGCYIVNKDKIIVN